MAYFQLASEQDVGDTGLAADAFRQLAGSVHPLALGNVKRTIEQISLLAKKLIRLHTPDADDTTLTEIVTRMTTEPYCHSHMFTRAEATAIGLPVERPSEDLEARLLAYYDQLKADLELLEKFDPGAILRASTAAGSGRRRAGLHRDRRHLRCVRDARSHLRAAADRDAGRPGGGPTGSDRTRPSMWRASAGKPSRDAAGPARPVETPNASSAADAFGQLS